MQLSTTFRHMDASPAVREYAGERLEKIRRYLQRDPLAAHAVFSVERGFNHVADLNITLANGILIKARETSADMYSSIDLAAARIERQVRKWKDKIRDHKPHHSPSIQARKKVLSAAGLEPRRGPVKSTPATRRRPTPPPVKAYTIIKEQTFAVRPLRVEEAVMQMNLLGHEFLVFANVDEATRGLAVVYKRKDGNYGLIETGAHLTS